jgi:carotenoid 1,2-hydratase
MDRAFDAPVERNGYRWWYLDALSDDGQHGLTLIAFIGSVFSPYYASARRRGITLAEDHCAINVALYQRGQPRWALTERGQRQLRRDAHTLSIGPSVLHWSAAGLTIRIDERCAPLPRRLRGEILVEGVFREDLHYALDAQGRHLWGPIAPAGRVKLKLDHPAVEWSGHAYFDSNAGAVPLEQDFRRWDWSRSSLPDGSTDVFYDVDRRDGGNTLLGMRFTAEAAPTPLLLNQRGSLPASVLWRVARATRLPAAGTQVLRTLEDTPFYARSLLGTVHEGQPLTAMHESLDLDRFASRWVQCLLPFRMPRLTGPA